MDYEEKYNRALERAKEVDGLNYITSHEIVEYLFPELAENEDEKIRKAINVILIATEDDQRDFYTSHKLTRQQLTDWLDKQKVSKEDRT